MRSISHNQSVDNSTQSNTMSQVIHEPGNYRLNELTTLLQSPAQKGSRRKYLVFSLVIAVVYSYIYSLSNFYLLEFDSTLAKMNSRKSSIGPNNPTSWMDNQQTVSQPLNGQKTLKRGDQSNTLRNMATSASRTQKASPSNFTSGSLKMPAMGGPTSNLRNLAGHLLMSGSSTSMRGISLNDALFKKNSDLQASVQEQLIVH